MIGPGLKKFADENNMISGHGMAYGDLRGYAVTLTEGSGYKRMAIAATFPNEEKKSALRAFLDSSDLSQYRVKSIVLTGISMDITFLDNPGTMTKIRDFTDWLFPQLQNYEISGISTCVECKKSLSSSDGWRLISDVAVPLHDACFEKLSDEIRKEEAQRREAAGGSYVSGFIGGLLGALLGAVLWALVMSVGYVASIIGYLIGWLANKGYDLLRGKQGPGKIAIIVIVTIIAVIIGSFGSDVIALISMINGGELPGIGYGDIPNIIFLMLSEDTAYLTATLMNLGLGLVFAFLGVFTILKTAKKQTGNKKIRNL